MDEATMTMICEQIVSRLREDDKYSGPSLTPTRVQPVHIPLQESEEPELDNQDCDERMLFDIPTVPVVEDQDTQSNESDCEIEWEKGLFLFNIAKKYGLDWAVPGGPIMPAARAESARSGSIEVRDKVRLPAGTMYDLLKHLNIHLALPHANEIVPETRQILCDAPKRIRTVPHTGVRPIPMNAYSGHASDALLFLEKNFLMPSVPNLPQAVYPKTASSGRNIMTTSIEAITALNILRDLPEEVNSEDYFKVIDHVTSLCMSMMKKAAEAFNCDILETRAKQLAGVDPAIRSELVNQPLIGDTLYTDYKKLLSTTIRARGMRGQYRHFRASRGGSTPRRPSWSPARSPAAAPSTSATGWGAPPAPASAWNPESSRGRFPRRPRGVRRGRR